ncbi:MAG TPA: amidohydrolase family protein [Gemmatimonadaceae bacterium]|nr:amidohydrolase family protein [Gemmatimonadaceae bacterium]
MRPSLHRLVLPVAALAALPYAASAQSMSIDAQSGTWALTNARIETVTRGAIDRGTVVIRNGIIEAVGANVTPPADARVVDLTGRTLYPGFIDLTSSLGLPQPQQQGRGGRGGIDPQILAFLGQPAQEEEDEPRIVGLEPNRNVATELRLTQADVRGARDQGITNVLVAPTRGLFRGLSALVPMRDDTATRWIVKSPVALHVGYQTVPGQYPGSLLGVIAYQRQAFYDAQRHAQIMERYRSNPRGMARVSYDADLDALVPVVKGELPAFIAATAENEMLRALALADEFKINVHLVGAVEGFRIVDKLKGARPPIVTVDFPNPMQVTGWQYKYSTQRAMDDSATRSAAAQKLIEGNAAALHSAGIRFALASGGLAPNTFLENVRKAIAAGLPRNVAVEALTIRPAEIAGVAQQLGSIETGKLANLLVFEGEALGTGQLRSVFVDGQQYDVVPAPPGGRGGRGGRGGNTPPPNR